MVRVSCVFVVSRLFRVKSFLAVTVGQFFLRLSRVFGFLVFGGIFWLGYILGLVTVVQGSGFFMVQSCFTLRVGQVFYVFLGFMVFQRLEIFSGQGTCEGQLRFCRVQAFQGFELFHAQGLLGLLMILQGLGFFSVQRFSGQGTYEGQLRLCWVQAFQGLEWFRVYGWLGLLMVGQGFGFFPVQRYFSVRVYLGVS